VNIYIEHTANDRQLQEIRKILDSAEARNSDFNGVSFVIVRSDYTYIEDGSESAMKLLNQINGALQR